MKKEITKLTKTEKEHIENKLLAIFAVALGSIMVFMYLINWFNGAQGFRTAAKVIVYTAVVAFIVLAVFLKIKANRFKKEDQIARAKKYNNWFIFSVVAAVVSFLTYPNDIIKLIIRDEAYGKFYASFWGRFTWFNQGEIGSRLILFMILIALYTIGVFVYYGIYLHKAHKASLNKGGKKNKK